MPFKKIIVNELKECPDCGGKSGLRYYVKMDVPFILSWLDDGIMQESIQLVDHSYIQPKTAKCIDCDRRVEFEIK